MKKLFPILLLAACYTPPVIQPDTSKPQQEAAKTAARNLAEMAPDIRSPTDRSVVDQGVRVLNDSAVALQTQGVKLNTCAAAETKCKEKYDALSKEFSDYKNKYGFWASFLSGWHWFGYGHLACLLEIALIVGLFKAVAAGLIKV